MSLLQTALHAWHQSHGAKMVEFGGWDMPIQYTAITPEHHAVRKSAGLFDIAHMGRLKFTGPDAERFLNHITTNAVSALQPGQIQYSLVTNETGGVLDDVLVYRMADHHMLVVNASNRLKILEWIEKQRVDFDFQLTDLTPTWFMLAIQGPLAVKLLLPLVTAEISALTYYWAVETQIMGHTGIVSRTGYTGEDGFEVMLPAEHGVALWEALFNSGKDAGLLPAGLGCRDTLRLEAAMPLYGHELNETVDPFTAGLAFAVKLDKGPFIGRDALVQAKANTARPKRVGLELVIKRIAREGTDVFAADGRKVGQVTSGTASPTLDKSIAMAYVSADTASPGTALEVDIRGQRVAATVVKLPFYKRVAGAT
ncbi:MAG: gcvT 2 [Planctomycetaceae bacterium]|nr:gcvT 2 [Planctomycetaceae bacterium]